MDVGDNSEIKKLIRKAELTRYIHGKLGEKREFQRKVVQVAIAVLGMFVSILAAVYYRTSKMSGSGAGSGWEEVLLLLLIGLPFIATTLVILDSTVWQFRDREEKHKAAVGIWGDWIRRAHESKSAENGDLEAGNVQKQYRKCMKATPNTSMADFIRYKKEWISYRQESSRLDEEQAKRVRKGTGIDGKRDGERPQ